jgi:putative thioredoxin
MQSPHIIDMTQNNFRDILQNSMNSPVLVYFWAPINQESSTPIASLRLLAQHYNGAFTLALLNCQEEQAIAAQFGIQTLPTIALFSQGQAIDGLGGPQPIEAIQAMLEKHLPSLDELSFNQAVELIKNEQYQSALPLLKALPDAFQDQGDVKLAIAHCLLETQQFDAAQNLLIAIPLEYQDGYFKKLVAILELQQQASNSPEIQGLEQALQANPSDAKLAAELAGQYHQAKRNEEALALLWSFIRSDLNTLDGEMKKIFMDILNALGQGNAIASQYRRKLYSILY